MPVMDVYTSVLSLVIVGWLGGLAATLLRLPRIVGMIFLGIALYPHLHPAVLFTPTTVSGSLAVVDAQNPASSIRTMALLIALMRGGLSVKSSFFKEMGAATALLAFLPYVLEMVTEALLAPVFLPTYYGTASNAAGVAPPPLAAWESASVWAALSPSICIPNMLQFVEQGLTEAGRVVLTGAPLEVSTALVVEGVMDGVLVAQATGADASTTLGHIPTYVLGSALYGLAFALGFWVYKRVRAAPRATAAFGAADPMEPTLVFVVLFLLTYTTSIDSVNTPWLVGFFAALCMAIATQYLLPTEADAICAGLKPAWFFAECFLFVLTGCVIRPAIDSGLSTVLFGNFLGLLLVGSLARGVGTGVVGVVWQWSVLKTNPGDWTPTQWGDWGRRSLFMWVGTTPKATLQGTLGPKVAKTFAAAAKTVSPTYLAPSLFVGPAAAVSILYCAALGTILTFLIGKPIAQHLQDQAEAAGGGNGGGKSVSAAPPAAAGAQEEATLTAAAASSSDSKALVGNSVLV